MSSSRGWACGDARSRPDPTSWATGYEWFDRMTRTLTESGYPVLAGATPREYAESTGVALAGRPETAAVADVPSAVTRAFYQARYGGRPPGGSEFARLAEDLDRLQAALRSGLPVATGRPETPR